MSHKSKKVKGRLGGHICPSDVLREIELKQGVELSGKMHDLAVEPTKPLKRARSNKEAYRPFRGR